MQVYEESLRRLRQSTLHPEHFVEAFKRLEEVVNRFGVPQAAIDLVYVSEADELDPDDLVPIITVALRPAALRKEKEA
jgi:hypothetical protein